MSHAPITVVRVSGTGELKYIKRESVDVPGQEGHMMFVGESRGRSRNTAGDDFLDDAETVVVEFGDLRPSGGAQQGYIFLTKGADSTLSRWTGFATIKPGPGQSPQISFQGTWEYIRGTGRYHGIQGGGTYQGEFLDEDRYVVRWEGERQSE